MPEIHDRRRSRVVARLRADIPDADALMVTGLANIRYLTGFTGSNAVLIITPGDVLLGTDARYAVQVGEQCPDLSTLLDRSTLAAMASQWSGRGLLAIEADHLSVADLRVLELSDVGPLVETTGLVETERVTKDAVELDAIERACRISDEALAATLPRIHAGATERDIARWLEAEMFAHGADGLAFDTIVGAGPNSAKPHHEPTARPVEEGEMLLIDFGASVDGYHSDQTRTFTVGPAQEWQREIHAVVLAAQTAGRVAASDGAGLCDVDWAARQVISEAGFGEFFGHGLGHGVGLEIHEAPYFSARATGMLHAGSSVTIEPGIYLPDRGGVRIEDTIWVGEGPSRPLTTSQRDLVALG